MEWMEENEWMNELDMEQIGYGTKRMWNGTNREYEWWERGEIR